MQLASYCSSGKESRFERIVMRLQGATPEFQDPVSSLEVRLYLQVGIAISVLTGLSILSSSCAVRRAASQPPQAASSASPDRKGGARGTKEGEPKPDLAALGAVLSPSVVGHQEEAALANARRTDRQLNRLAATRPASNPIVPLDDYVPCELNQNQMLALKFQEGVPEDYTSAVGFLLRQGILTPETANKLSNYIEANNPSAPQVRKFIKQQLASEIKAAPGKTIEQSIDKVVSVVSGPINAYTAPTDIACSMVMMPWQMAADSFGRHVADQYIAFHVVMRNLNTAQEFLMHNVSIAVDEQRFYSGIDKMIVRNSQDHGTYYDRRNFGMRALEVAGDIAAGASPYGSGDMQSGIGVFRSAVIPGVGKLFHDRTVDQAHSLSDMAFSSSMSYKIVVPVKGSAPFVTFLPADIFSRKVSSAKAVANQDSTELSSGKSKKKPAKKSWHYKEWSPDELHEFLENTYIIAAGIHVLEVHNDQPTVAALDCKGAPGTLDLSKTDLGGSTLTCTIQGTNLEKVTTLRLKNATESTDDHHADATVFITGGQNVTGTAVFKMNDLRALAGSSYAVYQVVNKTEIITNATVTLVPVIESLNPAIYTIPNAACTNLCSFTVKGQRLADLTSVSLVDKSGNTINAKFDSALATLTVAKSDLESLSGGALTVKGKTADGFDAISTAKLEILKYV